MENKLEQLTRKLYEEGLEKGRAEADKVLEDARDQAARIVAAAKAEAGTITAEAARKAEELSRNTHTELSLASRQSMARLKDMIAGAVTAHTLEPVKGLALDAAFLKDMLLAVASNWKGADGGATELTALLPAAMKDKFDAAAKGSLGQLLAAGVELQYSEGVKSGFRIGPRAGGYHISFTEEDFRALVGAFLNPRAAELLYGDQ